eukprot:1160947-Pelagomonas_calceolata.AAC.16
MADYGWHMGALFMDVLSHICFTFNCSALWRSNDRNMQSLLSSLMVSLNFKLGHLLRLTQEGTKMRGSLNVDTGRNKVAQVSVDTERKKDAREGTKIHKSSRLTRTSYIFAALPGGPCRMDTMLSMAQTRNTPPASEVLLLSAAGTLCSPICSTCWMDTMLSMAQARNVPLATEVLLLSTADALCSPVCSSCWMDATLCRAPAAMRSVRFGPPAVADSVCEDDTIAPPLYGSETCTPQCSLPSLALQQLQALCEKME